MKPKLTRPKLSEFLAKNGVQYKWEWGWPPIPMRRGPHETLLPMREPTPCPMEVYTPKGWVQHVQVVPPSDPPEWVGMVCEAIFDEVIPFTKKKDASVKYLDAALVGYIYAANKRGTSARVTEADGMEEELRKRRKVTVDTCQRRVAEVLSSWKLEDAADYMKGFSYGIACQQIEDGRKNLSHTRTMQIYKALVLYQDEVKQLTARNATASEIGTFIACRATRMDGATYAEYWKRHPVVAEAEEGGSGGYRPFLKLVEKIIGRMGIPLPPRGRPRSKSPI